MTVFRGNTRSLYKDQSKTRRTRRVEALSRLQESSFDIVRTPVGLEVVLRGPKRQVVVTGDIQFSCLDKRDH